MQVEVKAQYFPRLTEWHTRRALKWMNPADLAGVEFIRIMDEEPTAHNARKQFSDIWSYTYNGKYVKKNKHADTHINLYARDLYVGIPSLLKLTPVATIRIAHTLAHEVGHHLVTKRGYIYVPTEKYKPYGVYNENEERMCDKYAYDTMRLVSKSWYYRFGHWIGKGLSALYLELGAVSWEKQNYRRAAYYWFCAYSVDENNSDAADWYNQAIKRLGNSTTTRATISRRLSTTATPGYGERPHPNKARRPTR